MYIHVQTFISILPVADHKDAKFAMIADDFGPFGVDLFHFSICGPLGSLLGSIAGRLGLIRVI